MPLSYKITKIDTEKKVAELTVTFEDGSTYNKRMMVPVDSEESIKSAIELWLAEYIKVKAEEPKYNPSVLVNKVVTAEKFQKVKIAK